VPPFRLQGRCRAGRTVAADGDQQVQFGALLEHASRDSAQRHEYPYQLHRGYHQWHRTRSISKLPVMLKPTSTTAARSNKIDGPSQVQGVDFVACI